MTSIITDPLAATDPSVKPPSATSLPRGARGLLRRSPVAALAALWLGLVVLAVVLGPAFTLGPLDQDLAATMSGPTVDHWLGTDNLGRDVLARLLAGGRPTLTGVVIAVAVFLALGVPLGVAAGYFGGWTDRVVVLLSELLFATPVIIIVLVVLAVFGNDVGIAMVTLGVLGCGSLIRVLRGLTMGIKQELFVKAARASGLTEPQILRRHVLPQLTGTVCVQAFLFAGAAIIVETALGFLGFGASPPAPSWGNLVTDASQAINTHPWLLVPTGATIALTVLSLGLVGDAMRDLSSQRSAPAGPSRGARGASRRTAPARDASAQSVSGPSSSASTTALLSLRGLTVSAPRGDDRVAVVQDVSFDVEPGEIVGIVGESGCGKSVTAMAVLGLLRGNLEVTDGQILFDGTDLVDLPSDRRRALRGSHIAFVSQEPIASLDPAFSVGRQLREVVRRHHRLGRRDAHARVLELLRQVQLPDPDAVARMYPHQLSGGMAQRIGIAAALAGEPELLIADEPTTALDVTVQAEILQLLEHLRTTAGMAIMLVTHDFGVLAETCDRAVVMYAGQVVEVAPVADLLDDPAMPYSQALLRSNPALAATGAQLPAIGGTVPAPGDWPTGCHFQSRCPLATDACRVGETPLQVLSTGRSARCVRLGTRMPALDAPVVAHQPTTPSEQPLLRVEDLRVTYTNGRATRTAVDGVSFDLRPGTTLGLVGGSGAGKSTIGGAVLGLVPATSGRIVFDGRDITHVSPRERRSLTREIQVIFQDPFHSLNPARTVRQTLEEPLRLNLGLSQQETRRRVDQLLDQVGLTSSSADRYPTQFSGGQRQRIAIARALAVEPRLVVCDEAVSALDLSVQAQVLNLLKQLQADLGLTYLFVSHDLEVVRHMADDIAVLQDGALRELGPAARVYADPQHAYTRQLLDAAPSLDPARRRGRGGAGGAVPTIRLASPAVALHDTTTMMELR
jgi:oligopeptide/dipeptide ABC transporter ATP-binding protein